MSLNLDALKRSAPNFTHRKIDPELRIHEIEMSKIKPDPEQPRKNFEEESLQELADSIKEHGLIQPIVVRQVAENEYAIISGERRYRATQKLGLETIKCIIRANLKADEIGYFQMAENLKRANLNITEIAQFVCSKVAQGEKNVAIAEKLGLNKTTVSQYSAWENYPEELKKAIEDEKITSIVAAYVLYQKWQDYPEKTLEFICNNERISRQLAKSFVPSKIQPEVIVEPVIPNSEEPKEKETDETKESTSVNSVGKKSEEITSSTEVQDDEMTSVEEPYLEEGLVEGEDIKSQDGFESENLVSETDESECERPELERPCFFETEKEDDVGKCPKSSETQEEIENSELSEVVFSEEKETLLKKPVILCLVDGRECELLYKKPNLDGRVYVKWEDGTTEDVLAENVVINRIIEG